MNFASTSSLQKVNVVKQAAFVFTIIMGVCIFLLLGAEPQPEDFEFPAEEMETPWYIVVATIAPFVSTSFFFGFAFKEKTSKQLIVTLSLIQLVVSIAIAASIIVGFVQYFNR